MLTKYRYWVGKTCSSLYRGLNALVVFGIIVIIAITQANHLHGFIILGSIITVVGLVIMLATMYSLQERANNWAYTWIHTGKVRNKQQTNWVMILLGLYLMSAALTILGMSMMLTRRWWIAYLPVLLLFYAIGMVSSVTDDHLAMLASLPCVPREYYHNMRRWLKQHHFKDWAEVESYLLLAQLPVGFMAEHNFMNFAPTQGMTAVCRDFMTNVGSMNIVHQLLPGGLLPLTISEILGILSAQLPKKGGLRDEK